MTKRSFVVHSVNDSPALRWRFLTYVHSKLALSLSPPVAKRLALTAYTALVTLIVIWETWGAPATPLPRGFWLGIKLLPLLVALYGLWRDSYRAYVLAALLMLLYFCDGIATAYGAIKAGADGALVYAGIEIVVSLVFIATAPLYARFKLRHVLLQVPAKKES